MSKAYKCDRCGKFYEENIISHENERRFTVTKTTNGENGKFTYEFDLCGHCQVGVELFLKKEMFTPDEVCKAIQDYEHDPDTIFLGEKGRFTVADIRRIVEGMVDDK